MEPTYADPDGMRVALVTDGDEGLGRHVCHSLARLGFGVVINHRGSDGAARSLAAEIARSSRYARVVRADVCDKVDVASLFASVESREGRLDVLVNHHGRYEPEHLRHVTPEDWDECLASNLSSAFYCCYHARPLLEPSRGLIVNVGWAGVESLTANPWATAYQVAKTGLLVLTKSLAQGFGPAVRVNMVSPGLLEDSVDLPDDVSSAVPLGRAGTYHDIAHALGFLLDATYVTGVNIDVAGGFRLGG